ncbi:hypothetical protein BGX21_005693 [Mortierella sp. AD011]|nr:hypothetical protein BGX21_005693 [Mortierella sp. AD011]
MWREGNGLGLFQAHKSLTTRHGDRSGRNRHDSRNGSKPYNRDRKVNFSPSTKDALDGTESKAARPAGGSPVLCFKCNQDSHITPDCTNPQFSDPGAFRPVRGVRAASGLRSMSHVPYVGLLVAPSCSSSVTDSTVSVPVPVPVPVPAKECAINTAV